MEQRSEKRTYKSRYMGLDRDAIRKSVLGHLEYTVGKEPQDATSHDWFNTLAHTVRDRLTEHWLDSMHGSYYEDDKRVYYLSLEFLIGRTLTNAMVNLGIYEPCREVMRDMGMEMADIIEAEPEAGLGNGGLGRLAACFLGSMATLRIPGYGYGIRYEYGIFNQHTEDGYQVEHPDNWLRYGNPWEFARPELIYNVQFGGRVISLGNNEGGQPHQWVDTHDVMAMAFDLPVPGYDNQTVNSLRLWAAKSSRDFDLANFNAGRYIQAVREKDESETISKVLYPEDTTSEGKKLRLRQQYFFVSASLQDIIRRHSKAHGDVDNLPDKVAIQLNDTHPAIAIPELMRILIDERQMSWEQAWEITRQVFSYTNHTLLPEALETWSVALFEYLLPRHLEIIYVINHRFLKEVLHRFPGDVDRLTRMSIIDEGGERQVRMAHLACVGSHKVNGVARLHTQLMRSSIFRDFAELWPDKFISITNGVTPRRWLRQCNRRLSHLISSRIGEAWVRDLGELKKLEPLAEDSEFRQAFAEVKQANKRSLCRYIDKKLDLKISEFCLFDVQVKRMHEYKRQLLNLLHVVAQYRQIRQNPEGDYLPRVVLFAGKAAPGYGMAKLIIKLINEVADTVNNDPLVADRLKVVFMPNYNVSLAERIIPAADLSQQISTAGLEASGTGNMKLAMNGALTIGTLDGANIEIRDEVGEDNIFIFGLASDEVAAKRAGYDPMRHYQTNERLRGTLDMIYEGFFNPYEPDLFKPVVDTLLKGGDRYMLLADFDAYIDCQQRVEQAYREPDHWYRMAVLNVAGIGYFSSDRAVQQYAREIWGVG